MGCSQSKPGLLGNTTGDGKAFLENYTVDRIIGQGEFGIVKTCYSNSKDPNMKNPIACKILRKGIQFKDNTIYSAIKPHVLQTECGILQKLGGKHHTLSLVGIYESPSTIYILTEFMEGGDMFQYVSRYYGTGGNTNTSAGAGLRTEDVSRMSYQLLDAVNHCCKHGIMHRDIKPENIMFQKGEKGSALKLIDFGSGTFCASSFTSLEGGAIPDPATLSTRSNASTRSTNTNNNSNNNNNKESTRAQTPSRSNKPTTQYQYDLSNPKPPGMDEFGNSNNEPSKIQNANGDQLHLHTTFAGSAFYISPEMFRKHYTVMTDVWSVGVTLYVLVAGYPADALQEAFNKLQNNNRTIESLKSLPNIPENMPDTYFEMLHACLTYKHRTRKSAGDILEHCEFVKFHKEHADEEEAELAKLANTNNDDNVGISLNQVFTDAVSMKKTKSMLIEGSVTRHTAMLKYGQFERSVTSLLASVLVKYELKALLNKIDQVMDSNHTNNENQTNMKGQEMTSRKRLQIIKIAELRVILKELRYDDVLPTIDELSHGMNYDKFAYHVAFLRQFYIVLQDDNIKSNDTNDLDNSISRKLKIAMARRDAKNVNSGATNRSTHATESNTSEYGDEEYDSRKVSSIHNGNAWDAISKKLKMQQPRRLSF